MPPAARARIGPGGGWPIINRPWIRNRIQEMKIFLKKQCVALYMHNCNPFTKYTLRRRFFPPKSHMFGRGFSICGIRVYSVFKDFIFWLCAYIHLNTKRAALQLNTMCVKIFFYMWVSRSSIFPDLRKSFLTFTAKTHVSWWPLKNGSVNPSCHYWFLDDTRNVCKKMRV